MLNSRLFEQEIKADAAKLYIVFGYSYTVQYKMIWR